MAADENPHPRLILHVDDLAGSLGSILAFRRLSETGVVSSGSVMAPGPWLPELTSWSQTALPTDLGIHLTLTSESAGFRWRPLSTSDPASGLLDPAGYMWGDVPSLRAHAGPDAAETELRAQIDLALRAGLTITHLDHHMGAALSPEFVDGTVRIALDYGLPVLFPTDPADYFRVVKAGPVDIDQLAGPRDRLVEAGLALEASFVMGLALRDRPVRSVLQSFVTEAGDGVTFVSLHCSTGADIEAIHPGDGSWRIAEYQLLMDPEFQSWLRDSPVELTDVRTIRAE